MVDPRLRRNQLQMLLKKRTFISDNELYEMMRSRQVYQIQTELRKELDMRILALKHAQKLRMAGIKNQEAMFRKKVDMREQSKQRLTDVKAKMDAILRDSLSTERNWDKGSEDKLPIIGSHVIQQQVQESSTDCKNESDLEFPQNTMVKSDKLVTGTFESDINKEDQTWTLPSVNTEWMDKIKETPKRKISEISAINSKRGQIHTNSTNVSKNIGSHTGNFQPQHGRKQPEKINSRHNAENLDNRNVSVDKSMDLTARDSKISNDNVGENNEDAYRSYPPESATNQKLSDHKAVLRAKTLPTLEVHGTRERRKKAAHEVHDLHTDQISPFSSQMNESTVLQTTDKPINNPGQQGIAIKQSTKETSSVQQPPDLKTEEPINVPKKASVSVEKSGVIQPKKSVSLAKPKMPYFKRHGKMYTSENEIQKKKEADNLKTAHSLPGELERTITMLFIDESSEDDAPKSQFNFEAWLAYNRRKRGYSIVIDEKTFIETDKYNDMDDSRRSKKDSKNHVRFTYSRRLAKRDPPPQSFREKSKEWYLNFLEAKRKKGQRLTQRQKGILKGLSAHTYKFGYTVLPRIGVSLVDSNSNPVDKKNDRGHVFIVRESTDQKLQRLKDQSKFLQDRVQNFVYS